MRADLREALLIIAEDSAAEYEIIKRLSVEEFLSRYKRFIEKTAEKQKQIEAQGKAQKAKWLSKPKK